MAIIWQRMAVAWLKGKAAEQAQNNERWPDHAKCYSRWTDFVKIADQLAADLELEAKREFPATRVTELDEDHPLWPVNEQIKGLLEGCGATEDHEDVLSFLRATGLPEGTVERMHRAIVWGDTKVRITHELVEYQVRRLPDTQPLIKGSCWVPAKKEDIAVLEKAGYESRALFTHVKGDSNGPS